jgi:hypothetical protein
MTNQKTTVNGIERFRYMMGWIGAETILSVGSFIEVNKEEFEEFISTVNYRRKSYSDCTIYYNARNEDDHFAYHYDLVKPYRYIIKERRK